MFSFTVGDTGLGRGEFPGKARDFAAGGNAEKGCYKIQVPRSKIQVKNIKNLNHRDMRGFFTWILELGSSFFRLTATEPPSIVRCFVATECSVFG
jgi:hypothetical protein